MDDSTAETSDDWRQTGKCSACTFFIGDFGEPPVVSGHCKMKPRKGSLESTSWACPQYKPLPGFEDLTRSTDYEQGLLRGDSGSRGASRSPRRRSTHREARPAVVLRRRWDGPLPPSALEAFGEGDETMDSERLRDVLIDVIENFIGIEDVELGDKWHGGRMVLYPENDELKPHEIPLETFFHKVVMIRDRLRVLEQKINSNDHLDASAKIDLQQYVSRCYGSLTSFNVLFKNKEDKFSSK